MAGSFLFSPGSARPVAGLEWKELSGSRESLFRVLYNSSNHRAVGLVWHDRGARHPEPADGCGVAVSTASGGRTQSSLDRYQGGSASANDLPDIASRDDVVRLVQTFYTRAFADPLIGPIFTELVHMDLPAHLPVMADFWQTVLFKAGLYKRNALNVHFGIHRREPLTINHFNTWLALWSQTVDELFSGEKAELAKSQAHVIAGSMHRRVSGEPPSSFQTIAARVLD